MLEDETSDKLYSSKPRYPRELMLKLPTNIIRTLNSEVPIDDILKTYVNYVTAILDI